MGRGACLKLEVVTLRELVAEIKKLSHAEQYRLKEFFVQSRASFSASGLAFQEVAECKSAYILYSF